MLKARIEVVLKTLTYREREIIKLRYGIGDGYTYTLEEVGRIFKVTRERVRQVEAKAIRKLQHPVRARKLQGFVDGSVYKEVRGEMDSASHVLDREQMLNRVEQYSAEDTDLSDDLAENAPDDLADEQLSSGGQDSLGDLGAADGSDDDSASEVQ